MARMPDAVWLGEHSPGVPMDRYDIVCVHTIVGFAPAHAAHFSVKADGTIMQSRDTRFRSGANLDGNRRVIAVENEDHGDAFGTWDTNNGHAVPALTDAQVEANAAILKWAHETHGIPLQLCSDSRPTSRGLAYHRQGIDGNFLAEGYTFPGRVDGGEIWTTSPGKVCPGDRRIAQLPDILRIATEGADVPWTDDLPKVNIPDDQTGDTLEAGKQLAQARGFAAAAYASSLRAEKAVQALAAALGPEVQQAVEAALADAVINVNVNIGNKESTP